MMFASLRHSRSYQKVLRRTQYSCPAWSSTRSLSSQAGGDEPWTRILDTSKLNRARDDVVMLEMNRKPVNALNLEFLTELEERFAQLEADPSIRGVVLTSSSSKIFSAGLDLSEMVDPDEKRLRDFWIALQNLFMRMYVSPLVLVSAIQGPALAAGTMLNLCCDVRVLENKPGNTMGLLETQFGLNAPFWFLDALEHVVGSHSAEVMASLGAHVGPEEALKTHLIDRLVPTDAVIDTCMEEMEKWLCTDDLARHETKKMMRKRVYDRLLTNRDDDVRVFTSFVNSRHVQNSLKAYLGSLGKEQKPPVIYHSPYASD